MARERRCALPSAFGNSLPFPSPLRFNIADESSIVLLLNVCLFRSFHLVLTNAPKRLIEQLKESWNIKEIKGFLKQLQRYTVNLFREGKDIKELRQRKAIDESVLDGSVLILRKEFYREDIGISQELEDLICD